jgi:hypothetical protein
MIRTIALPVLVGTVLLGGVPALADQNGSTEQRTEKRSCTAEADPHYSEPTEEDCQDGSTTYDATYYSNDVKCGDDNALVPTNPTGIRVYGSGDPTTQSGSLGACADGSGAAPNPVQGRASVGGSPATGPRIVVDGDKDNSPEQAQGYLLIEGTSYRCGHAYSDGGKADSDTPEDKDSSEDCG